MDVSVKTIEQTGKTVEEAVQLALQQLNATREEVEVEIVDEGSRGVLGLIGQSMAKVRVTLKPSFARCAKELVEEIARAMKLDLTVEEPVEVEVEEEGYVRLNLRGADSGIIIGKGGATLTALQYLVNVILSRKVERAVKVKIDAESYRIRREAAIAKMAIEAAKRVKTEGRRVGLRNLTAAERRIVHKALQDDADVFTYSEGEEPDRVVIIAPISHKQRRSNKR